MKVGEYIRTPFGIRKIVDIEKDECYKPRVKILVFDRYIEDVHHFGYKFYTDEKIIKNSKFSENILDLIHVGDYVNGCIVINKKDDIIQIIQLIIPFDLKEKDIKSIVTKEEFSQMEYRIGEWLYERKYIWKNNTRFRKFKK